MQGHLEGTISVWETSSTRTVPSEDSGLDKNRESSSSNSEEFMRSLITPNASFWGISQGKGQRHSGDNRRSQKLPQGKCSSTSLWIPNEELLKNHAWGRRDALFTIINFKNVLTETQLSYRTSAANLQWGNSLQSTPGCQFTPSRKGVSRTCMPLWLFLTRLGHLPIVLLNHSLFIVNKSLRWKEVASTYATRQSLKEGFPVQET